MNPIDELKNANPVQAQEDWGSSVAGRAILASVVDRIDGDAELQPPPASTPRPWVYAATGFAIVVLAAVPLLWSGRSPELDPLALPQEYSSISDDVLDDMFVTDEELELAANAVVECTTELSNSSEPATTYEIEPDGSVSFTTRDGPNGETIEAFETCHRMIFSGIERIWADQNRPPPASDFYFYGGVVVCTEQQTGRDFGEMTRDPLGFVSTVGERTINKALDEESGVYLACFDLLLDQVSFYNEVLACISLHVGATFERLEPRFEPSLSRGELLVTEMTPAGLDMLDHTNETYPEVFNNCWENVARFLSVSPGSR